MKFSNHNKCIPSKFNFSFFIASTLLSHNSMNWFYFSTCSPHSNKNSNETAQIALELFLIISILSKLVVKGTRHYRGTSFMNFTVKKTWRILCIRRTCVKHSFTFASGNALHSGVLWHLRTNDMSEQNQRLSRMLHFIPYSSLTRYCLQHLSVLTND